jgi:uncharacterized membrane protein (DUF373 family)
MKKKCDFYSVMHYIFKCILLIFSIAGILGAIIGIMILIISGVNESPEWYGVMMRCIFTLVPLEVIIGVISYFKEIKDFIRKELSSNK